MKTCPTCAATVRKETPKFCSDPWHDGPKVFIAISDTNYGVGVHGVFSSLEAAQRAIPGEWTHDDVNGWTSHPEGNNWPVRLVETELDAIPGSTWLIHGDR